MKSMIFMQEEFTVLGRHSSQELTTKTSGLCVIRAQRLGHKSSLDKTAISICQHSINHSHEIKLTLSVCKPR